MGRKAKPTMAVHAGQLVAIKGMVRSMGDAMPRERASIQREACAMIDDILRECAAHGGSGALRGLGAK